jgi:hypothetical protein
MDPDEEADALRKTLLNRLNISYLKCPLPPLPSTPALDFPLALAPRRRRARLRADARARARSAGRRRLFSTWTRTGTGSCPETTCASR